MIASSVIVLLGVWLMLAPWALDYGGAAAINDRIVGPMVVSLAAVAVGECTREIRRALYPFAAWLVLAPVALGFGGAAAVSAVLTGIGIGVLAWAAPPPAVEKFGGGWTVLWGAGARRARAGEASD